MTEELSPAVQDIVVEEVRSHLQGVALRAIRVRPELGHAGDPQLRVEIVFRPEDEAIRSGMGLGVPLIDRIWMRLATVGETRFPMIRFLNADEVPAGDGHA